MKIIADTHCHTIASTHAYSTVTELVHAAAKQGLYAVAVTDHATTMPGSPGRWYFRNLKVLPREMEGVLILRGSEVNVIDYEGNIDLCGEETENLDWMVASIHNVTMASKEQPNVELCTQTWLNIAKNPQVNVIGHSGSEKYRYDYETVIPEFGRQGKLVEINENSFLVREKSIPNCVTIAKTCKKYRVPIVINSDAHFHTQLGYYHNTIRMLEEIGFPEELVINADIGRFKRYLEQYTPVFH